MHQNSDATIRHLIRSIDMDRQTWFERHEGPTLLVAFAIYASWIVLLSLHHMIPWWLLAVAGGYVIQWHFSLQHEAIHAMRGLPKWLRIALVYPPIGGWLPFELYRRSHLQHHQNGYLTYPRHDTESYYHEREDWEKYGQVCRGLLIVNQTFIGRLFVGPVLRTPQLYWKEGCKIVSRDTANVGIWLRHLVAFALVLLAVTVIFDMEVWVYFANPGLVFGMVRGYIETVGANGRTSARRSLNQTGSSACFSFGTTCMPYTTSFRLRRGTRCRAFGASIVIASSRTTAGLCLRATTRSPGDG